MGCSTVVGFLYEGGPKQGRMFGLSLTVDVADLWCVSWLK
jgi:hypothetical protein